jgi:hypothetical protein
MDQYLLTGAADFTDVGLGGPAARGEKYLCRADGRYRRGKSSD